MVKRCLAFFVLSICSFSAFAGNVSLYPTSIVASSAERSGVVVVENHGDSTERFQVTALDWSQDAGGHDRTGPTTAVIAAPSIVEIPQGARRAVRLIRTEGVGTPGYYRVLLRQLPGPLTSGNVQLLINQNLPLAFEDPKSGAPSLTARFTDGGLMLSNTGKTAARLTTIGPEGQPVWREGALGWVLPGQAKRVDLKSGQKAPAITITVNGAPVTVAVN